MKFIKYLLILGLTGSTVVHAASFDCDKARTRVEKTICRLAPLSELDEKLDAAFISSKEGLQPVEAKRVAQELVWWLRNVRNSCADETCLVKAYMARLDELDPLFDHKLTCSEMQSKATQIFNSGVDLGSGSGSPTEVDYHCPDSLGELPFMKKLLNLAEVIRSDGGPQVCTGSLIHAQWRYYQFGLTQAGLAPRTMQAWSSQKGLADWKTFVAQDVTGTTTYFQQWSELSHVNKTRYAEFVREFDNAAAQLVSRYMGQYGMSAVEAQSAAKVALSEVVQRAAGSASKIDVLEEFPLLTKLRLGPTNGAHIVSTLSELTAYQPLRALRVALISDQPQDVIAALTGAVDPAYLREDEEAPRVGFVSDRLGLNAIQEPLLSLALGSLANLEYLLRKGVPVNAVNGFGKTTLFYAIGASNHAAVELLLRYQADVHHTYKSNKELRPDNDECFYVGLKHTRRTTLMHAAQNSDVHMLKILLAAGAPLRALDDLGFNAHDYALMGKNRDNALYLASLGLEPAAPH